MYTTIHLGTHAPPAFRTLRNLQGNGLINLAYQLIAAKINRRCRREDW